MDLASELRKKDEHCRAVLDALLTITRPDIVCDIGSYNGDDIARLRTLVPSSECFAFEANPHNVQSIKSREELKDVRIENLAISDYDGSATFNILNSDVDEWKRLVGSLIERSDGQQGEKVTVPCVRLDTYFREALAQGKTFLLWIDVEGALDRVIRGAPEVLRRTIAFRAEVEHSPFWVGQTLAKDNISAILDAGFMLLADTYTDAAMPQSDILCLNRNWLELSKQNAD